MVKINLEQHYYSLLPKVVRADQEQVITIVPLYKHVFFEDDAQYLVSVVPMEHIVSSGKETPCTAEFDLIAEKYGEVIVTPQNGAIKFKWFFAGEQEHLIYLRLLGQKEVVGTFHVYSLEEDLFTRFPFKGDLHMHSCRSDGREAPAYVAACSRRIGLDFMALTDHGLYQPSLEARSAFDLNQLDLKIFPGEEVHAPDNFVHIINFAGKFSVNDLFRGQNYAKYKEEVQEREKGLPALPQGVSSYQYASCLWVFDKIRESEGLGIFCHPYWLIPSGYSPSIRLTDYIFETQPFDAYEVIGGYYRNQMECNALQVARYHQEQAKGRKIPIVGVTDAHGCEGGELFGWYYTIVFAPSTEASNLIASIKDLYSVAVEAVPGEFPRIHGPLRLVKFAYFALRELFSEHDELAKEEGLLMLEHLKGRQDAEDKLADLKGRTLHNLKIFWAA